MWKRVLLVGLALLLEVFPRALGSGKAERLVYREQTGDRQEIHTYRIEPLPVGYRVLLTRRVNGGEIIDECTTDPAFSTLTWRHRSLAQDTDVTAVRKDNVIDLFGRKNGRDIRKSFAINPLPWKQLFSIDFNSFALMPVSESGFWSIGTAGAGDMKIGQFVVRRLKSRSIIIGGRRVESVCLRVSLRGMLSTLWHGEYWMRREDGRYLRHEGRNGLFAAKTVKELLSEE